MLAIKEEVKYVKGKIRIETLEKKMEFYIEGLNIETSDKSLEYFRLFQVQN